MSMRRTYNRVQSFPTPESEMLSALSNQFDQTTPHKLQKTRISASRLSKVMHASIFAQKMGMRLAMDAINPTTGNKSDWEFINCYLDSTVLLLDACRNIEQRLESIKSRLNSVLIGLHYLEGDHKPSTLVLQRVVASLNFTQFSDKQLSIKMEKIMPRMKTFGRKLSGQTMGYQDNTDDSISSELYKALNGSWEMAVVAIGVLSSATTIWSPKVEQWTLLLNEISKKIAVFPKKLNMSGSMEELVDTHLAAQALIKIVSSWKKEECSTLRRVAVKAVAGELRRRNEELEKALPLLEENVKELYRQIVVLRVNLLGLVSKANKDDVLELIKSTTCEESQMNTNPERYQRSVTWVRIKTKRTRRSFLLSRIRPHCIWFSKRRTVKSNA